MSDRALSTSWSTQQLAEFVVAISGAPQEATALERGIESAVEALDAEVGAVVREHAVVASIGWPRFDVPDPELVAIAAAGPGEIAVPGDGSCPAVVVPLDDDRGGALVVARTGESLDAFELNLLGGMARTLALTLKMHGVVEAERGLRLRSQEQARENARLLSRLQERQRLLEGLAGIQRSISSRAPLNDTLAAIMAAAGELLPDGSATVFLRDPDNPRVLRAANGESFVLGEGAVGRAAAEGRLVLAERARHGRPAMAAPVCEQGEVVGALGIRALGADRTYTRAEQDVLHSLAEHASLAITDARTVGAMLHQALHDSLTGLPNRALFLDRLSHALERGRRANRVGVLFCDLDRFKTVNDSGGHAAGDELLVAVASRIGGCLRTEDTAARLGGDEFAVLIEDVRSDHEATAVAERVI